MDTQKPLTRDSRQSYRTISCWEELLLLSGFWLGAQSSADVDESIGNHAEPDPAFHSRLSLIAATAQTVSPLEDAEATLAASPPLLGVAETRIGGHRTWQPVQLPLMLLDGRRQQIRIGWAASHTFRSW